MRPVPYANPIGRIEQDRYHFTFDDPQDSGSMTAGTQLVVLRYATENGTVVKVQGTVTSADQAGARFAVTGPWANQEDLLREGAPVYLELAD